jgi:hypothetical protein
MEVGEDNGVTGAGVVAGIGVMAGPGVVAGIGVMAGPGVVAGAAVCEGAAGAAVLSSSCCTRVRPLPRCE